MSLDEPKDRLEEIKRAVHLAEQMNWDPAKFPREWAVWLIAELERFRRLDLCAVCGGGPAPDGGCICGGTGSAGDERAGLRLECIRMREENERLRESVTSYRGLYEEARDQVEVWKTSNRCREEALEKVVEENEGLPGGGMPR